MFQVDHVQNLELIIVFIGNVVNLLISAENEESLLHFGSQVILDILRVNFECSYLIILNLVDLVDTNLILVARMWLDLHYLTLDAFSLDKI